MLFKMGIMLFSMPKKVAADFAKIQAPLNELLKGTSGENRKFAPCEWKDYHQKAFLTLKKALVSFPILSVFDPPWGFPHFGFRHTLESK